MEKDSWLQTLHVLILHVCKIKFLNLILFIWPYKTSWLPLVPSFFTLFLIFNDKKTIAFGMNGKHMTVLPRVEKVLKD